MSLVHRVRPYTRYVAPTALGLTTALILALRWMGAGQIVLSSWQPGLLFGGTLTLQIDLYVQPLALALAVVTLSAALVEASRKEESSPQLAVVAQILLPVGLAALWSGNVLTMIICWTIYDLLQVAGQIVAGSSSRTVIRSSIMNGLATLSLWGGELLSGGRVGSETWTLMTLTVPQTTLWMVAGMLRLWIYPFHLSAPDDLETASPFIAPLFLGPIVGWGLWLRIASAGEWGLPASAWVLTLAAVTLLGGGFLTWSCESPRRMLPWIGTAVTGASLLAAGLGGENALTIVTAGSVSWGLGMALLLLGNGDVGHTWRTKAIWWSVPSLIAAAALIGMPFTLGFASRAPLLSGLIREERLAWQALFFFGHLFLVPSLARWLLTSPRPTSSPPDRRWSVIARGIGLGLPALLLLGAGLYPRFLINEEPVPSLGSLLTTPGLKGWLLWIASLVGGGVLIWQESNLRPAIETFLNATHDLIRLEWLYNVVVGALDRGLSVIRVTDEVIGGAGALLWSLLLFLLILLVQVRL
ncbi:MAG: hypothetical protein DRI48_00905 [Chloroflexi bacterium]|nr:MAG: hypothetical protein DRI48_00905 [Chloroflexota bacterium]